ncbi:MAG: gephyrin-like molybdotransferase Glp [Gemmataceae bacterium]
MLSVTEAQDVINQRAKPLAPVPTELTSEVLGLVLAEDVASDLDMPPYDKALMDGYAVRAADLAGGQATLQVVDELTAGQISRKSVGAGQAIRIMTGAPIPEGADAVVMIERTRLLGEGRVHIDDRPAQPGQNVLPRGKEMRKGDTILHADALLRPQEFGLLSSVGRIRANVHPRPEVAILPTGDELVEPNEVPGPGQIRNSNGPMLAAQVRRAGGIPQPLGIGRDRPDQLRMLISEGLRRPMLILSGGVSAGKLDLVPGILQELGVEPHFHKVAMKPGKPVFFGTRRETLVFGLPGNPVSSLVCFELFVRPAIRRQAGHKNAGPTMIQARLAEAFSYRIDRPTYHPAWLENGPDGWLIRAVPWFGSSDLRGLTQANAFALFPAGDGHHQAGQSFAVLKVEE